MVGYYNAGDRTTDCWERRAFWGGTWGLLFGSAFCWIPGLGPLLVTGPLVAWIVGALEGTAVMGGSSAVGAGSYSMGMPKGQRPPVRDRGQVREVPTDRPWNVRQVTRANETIHRTDADFAE